MSDLPEIEIEEHFLDAAHALCENVINYYRTGKGIAFRQIPALLSLCVMTGEAVYTASPNSDTSRDILLCADTEMATVYDYVVAMSYEAGATDDDIPDADTILSGTKNVIAQGAEIPDLSVLGQQAPDALPFAFAAETREATNEFFDDQEIDDEEDRIVVLSLAVGAMIQALSEGDKFPLYQLVPAALSSIFFAAHIEPQETDAGSEEG